MFEDQHQSPEWIARIFGISRRCIDDGLRGYRAEGEAALATRPAPGAAPVLTPEWERGLHDTILTSTPVDQG